MESPKFQGRTEKNGEKTDRVGQKVDAIVTGGLKLTILIFWIILELNDSMTCQGSRMEFAMYHQS